MNHDLLEIRLLNYIARMIFVCVWQIRIGGFKLI